MINDLNIYNERMQNGLEDKLFFLPNIPSTPFLFIDFGCADGTLLNTLQKVCPQAICFGIDSNLEMLELAKQKCSSNLYKTYFYQDLESCLKYIRMYFNDFYKILNFSSVMHEIYHYLSQKDKDRLLTDAFSGVFDEIYIRDMSYISIDNRKDTPLNSLQSLYKKKEYEGMIGEFEKCFGSLSIYKNFVHFLMKYKYKENWSRECKEDYFFDITDMEGRLGKHYKFEKESYKLPYLSNLWKEEFHIDVLAYTHFHLVAKKM